MPAIGPILLPQGQGVAGTAGEAERMERSSETHSPVCFPESERHWRPGEAAVFKISGEAGLCNSLLPCPSIVE